MYPPIVLVLSLALATQPAEVDPANSRLILLEVRKAVAARMQVDLAKVAADTTFADLGADDMDTFSVSGTLQESFGIALWEPDDWARMSMEDVAAAVKDELVDKSCWSAGRKLLEHHLKNPSLRPMTPKEIAAASFLTPIERDVLKRKGVSRYRFTPTRDEDYSFQFHYPAGFFSYDIFRTPRKPVDRSIEDAKRKSSDLAADKKLMWQTALLEPPKKYASTREAVWAASRVFNTVELTGKTRDEAIAMLGDPKTSSNSVYNFPFYPINGRKMVYRFDTGAYGWQFDLELDRDDIVSQVERRWIH